MTANGEVLPWDRLIVCTGWNYLLPDVPGNDLEGITFVKNIRRGIELNETLNDVKKAVVLEAGPLGVEMLDGARAPRASRPTWSTRTRGCWPRSPTPTSPSRCRRAWRSWAASCTSASA